MKILGMEVRVKDYDCSFDEHYKNREPIFNLYVQVCNYCNAHCDFCKLRDGNGFDISRFKEVIDGLYESGYVKRISITGGEPLLVKERVLDIIDVIDGRFPIVLNTNAYDLDKLSEIYDKVDSIYVSKHHYINQKNDSVMGIHTPDIKELADFDKDNKITLNCVLQKGLVDSADEMKRYMNFMGETSIRNVKFISLYELTKEASKKLVDIDVLLKEFSNNVNGGILYDKNYCCCLDFAYITDKWKVVNAVLRNNKTNHFDCCRQLVYNGNNLYSGFEPNSKILY